MAMFNLINDGAQFTAQSLMEESHAEEFRDPVGSQSPKPDLAAALENLMDREVALEDEIVGANQCTRGFQKRGRPCRRRRRRSPSSVSQARECPARARGDDTGASRFEAARCCDGRRRRARS